MLNAKFIIVAFNQANFFQWKLIYINFFHPELCWHVDWKSEYMHCQLFYDPFIAPNAIKSMKEKADADCMHLRCASIKNHVGIVLFLMLLDANALRITKIKYEERQKSKRDRDRIDCQWNNKFIFQQCKMARIPLSDFHFQPDRNAYKLFFYDATTFLFSFVHVCMLLVPIITKTTHRLKIQYAWNRKNDMGHTRHWQKKNRAVYLWVSLSMRVCMSWLLNSFFQYVTVIQF